MRSKKDYVHLTAYLILTVGIGVLPAVEPITQMGMRIVGIMVGAIYAWCTLDMIWPSFVALILVGLTGYSNVTALYASSMSNNTVMIMLFMLLFGGIVTVSGVGRALAIRIVNLKIASGKPWVLSILIMLSAFLPALILGSIPATLICWSIIYSICEEVGIEKKSSWPVFIIFMTAVEGIRAMNVLPFQISVVAVLGFAQAVDPALTIPYAQWIMFTLIYCLIEMLILTLVYKLIMRPDVSRLKNYVRKDNIEPFTYEQKWALGLLVALIVLLMIPSLFPKGNPVVDTLNMIGTIGIIALVVGFSQLATRNGMQLFPIKEIAHQGISWPMLVMTTTTITLSSAMTSAESGVAAFLSGWIAPLFSGIPGEIFGIALLIIALITTNVLANSVVGLITITLLFTLGESVGLNPMLFFALLLISGNSGFMFPSSSSPAAMLYGNSEWIGKKDIILYSAIFMVVVGIMFVVVGVPMANLFF